MRTYPVSFVFLLISCFWSLTSVADSPNPKVYELEVETDSNWTSIEIRDDAEWVNAPHGASLHMGGKRGIKAYTLSPKKIFLKSASRGRISMNLFVKSPNKVLGMTICKGSRTSYTWIKSSQSKQVNDTHEHDYCEKAALVLQLH